MPSSVLRFSVFMSHLFSIQTGLFITSLWFYHFIYYFIQFSRVLHEYWGSKQPYILSIVFLRIWTFPFNQLLRTTFSKIFNLFKYMQKPSPSETPTTYMLLEVFKLFSQCILKPLHDSSKHKNSLAVFSWHVEPIFLN